MKTLCLLVAVFFISAVKAQNIEIPDANFKERLLLASTANLIACDAQGNSIQIDTNQDGEIQFSEALSVKKLNITWWQDSPISSLEGILNFVNLEELDCHRDVITALDLTGMSNLKRLACSDNLLTGAGLKLDGCTSLEYLNCGENGLSELDLSDCHNLTELYCRDNNLIHLDVSGCSLLEKLHCHANPNLLTINMQNNNQENWLNFTMIPSLQHVCADESDIQNVAYLVANYQYNCLVDTSCLFLQTQSFVFSDAVSIYPNPAHNIVNIYSETPVSAANIYNNVGQLVLSLLDTQNIDVTVLPVGNYFIKVTSDNQTQTFQFLKN
jgi:hypothetical protein